MKQKLMRTIMDIRATYTYEMCDEIFAKLKYARLYQDNGLAIFEGKKTQHQTITWLRDFQIHVNAVVGGDFLQFTAELWSPPGEDEDPLNEMESSEMMEPAIPEEEWDKWEEKVMVVRKEEFPYLNMKLYWSKQELRFAVYNKENQRIKYVNRESCHRAS
eukprot:10788506-Ditylum_brightwellii.AAC.1